MALPSVRPTAKDCGSFCAFTPPHRMVRARNNCVSDARSQRENDVLQFLAGIYIRLSTCAVTSCPIRWQPGKHKPTVHQHAQQRRRLSAEPFAARDPPPGRVVGRFVLSTLYGSCHLSSPRHGNDEKGRPMVLANSPVYEAGASGSRSEADGTREFEGLIQRAYMQQMSAPLGEFSDSCRHKA